MVQRSKKRPTAAAPSRRGGAASTRAKRRAPDFARLKRKYGAAVIEALARVHPDHVTEHVEWCDALDQNFTKLWLDFTYGGMAERGILDERTRRLVVVGQFVVMDEMEQLAVHIREALHHANPREVLEVILQAAVYLGYPKIIRATRVFTRTLRQSGRLDEITRTQLPLDGHRRGRSLSAERRSWGVTEADCPRLEELLRKFGWEGLSSGFRLQPSHHHRSVEQIERVDQHFLKLWLDFIYAGMYARRILDDRTRILCVIGELFVMGEFVQIENHIRNALMQGATPREVLEVILQSTIYAGMPRFVRVIALIERVLTELGRLHELTDTQLPLPAA